MQGQEKLGGNARMIGYGIGLVAFIALALWKFLAR
jgi:hypothetical protein